MALIQVINYEEEWYFVLLNAFKDNDYADFLHHYFHTCPNILDITAICIE